jgi:hypothetical protein
MLAEYLLLPLLASYASAVQISVAKSGGNVTTGLQYGAMEEVCLGDFNRETEILTRASR